MATTRFSIFNCQSKKNDEEESEVLLKLIQSKLNQKKKPMTLRYLSLFFSGLMLLGLFGFDGFLIKEMIREKAEIDGLDANSTRITSTNYAIEVAFPVSAFALFFYSWFFADMISSSCRNNISNKMLGCDSTFSYKNIPIIQAEIDVLTLKDLDLDQGELSLIFDFFHDRVGINTKVSDIIDKLEKIPTERKQLLN